MDEIKEKKEQQSEIKKKAYYPSSKIALEACYQDYMRLHDRYDKLYDKISIAIAFIGILLPLMIGALDSELEKLVSMKWLLWFYKVFILLCIVTLILSFYKLLKLMKGEKLNVLLSEDIRNNELYREEENNLNVWLIDKYTECNYKNRPIIEMKQKEFDKCIKGMTIGIIFYSLALIIGKVII